MDKRIFWLVYVIEVSVPAVSGVFTYCEQVGFWATFACYLTSFVVLVLGFVAYRTQQYGVCYLAMFYTIGIVLMPSAFFFSGGVECGSPMYCCTLMLMGAIAPSTSRLARWIGFGIVLVVMGSSMVFSISGSELSKSLMAEISPMAAAIDIVAAYIIMSFVIFLVGMTIVEGMRAEKARREEVEMELDARSKHDPASGLFNRIYLVQYLESMVWPQKQNFYALVFELDRFREIREQYGLSFGNKIFMEICEAMRKVCDEEMGECMAALGGPLFGFLIQTETEVQAVAKVDRLREIVGALRWEMHPELRVSISGGFLPCSYRGLSESYQVLEKGFELLVIAKSYGDNQIRNVAN